MVHDITLIQHQNKTCNSIEIDGKLVGYYTKDITHAVISTIKSTFDSIGAKYQYFVKIQSPIFKLEPVKSL
jgi:hypothetical protein